MWTIGVDACHSASRRSTAKRFNISVIAFGVNHWESRGREDSPGWAAVAGWRLDGCKLRQSSVLNLSDLLKMLSQHSACHGQQSLSVSFPFKTKQPRDMNDVWTVNKFVR